LFFSEADAPSLTGQLNDGCGSSCPHLVTREEVHRHWRGCLWGDVVARAGKGAAGCSSAPRATDQLHTSSPPAATSGRSGCRAGIDGEVLKRAGSVRGLRSGTASARPTLREPLWQASMTTTRATRRACVASPSRPNRPALRTAVAYGSSGAYFLRSQARRANPRDRYAHLLAVLRARIAGLDHCAHRLMTSLTAPVISLTAPVWAGTASAHLVQRLSIT
jgi:hypothetical protein